MHAFSSERRMSGCVTAMPRLCCRPGLALGDRVELWLGEIYRAVPLVAHEEVRRGGAGWLWEQQAGRSLCMRTFCWQAAGRLSNRLR